MRVKSASLSKLWSSLFFLLFSSSSRGGQSYSKLTALEKLIEVSQILFIATGVCSYNPPVIMDELLSLFNPCLQLIEQSLLLVSHFSWRGNVLQWMANSFCLIIQSFQFLLCRLDLVHSQFLLPRKTLQLYFFGLFVPLFEEWPTCHDGDLFLLHQFIDQTVQGSHVVATLPIEVEESNDIEISVLALMNEVCNLLQDRLRIRPIALQLEQFPIAITLRNRFSSMGG